jgi:hypothetical protein
VEKVAIDTIEQATGTEKDVLSNTNNLADSLTDKEAQEGVK